MPGSGSASGSGDWTRWLHDPGDLFDHDLYQAFHFRPRRIVEHEDEFDEDLFEALEAIDESFDHVDVDFDEVDSMVIYTRIFVLLGAFTVEDVVEELDDHDYDDEAEHEGFEIFLSADERQAVGVSEAVLVLAAAGPDDDADEVVEHVIDTGIGEEDRYVDEDEGFAAMVDALPEGDIVLALPHEEPDDTDAERGVFENSVGVAMSLQLQGETTAVTIVVGFAEEDDVDLDDVEEHIDENDGTGEPYDDFDDLEFSQRGTVALVEGVIDTDDLTSRFFGF